MTATRPDPSVIDDPWRAMATPGGARIGLGRAGASLPTAPLLAFQLAHARARDAVHESLDVAALAALLAQQRIATVAVTSRARDRREYLLRPDRGRRLDETSAARLAQVHAAARAQQAASAGGPAAEPAPPPEAAAPGFDLAIVIADGLSAAAPQRHAWPVLAAVLPVLTRWQWTLAPVVLATQARVALGDDIAERLGARMVAMMIGERPGLSAADSLGIYLTLAPKVGCTDAQRNCLSNIRDGGLAPQAAAHSLLYLARQARVIGQSGVALKDDSARAASLLDARASSI
ncbi:MAG TPA: ethanolamine ammonia-lyase subunit EutC [Burkholderiaceae bacterium]|nr:ethanolamine ammonia-lyase subunit EutC [Burkholderiaceae bacterium]